MTSTDRQQRIKRQRKRRVAKGIKDMQPHVRLANSPVWLGFERKQYVDAMKRFTDQLDRIIPDYQKNGWVHC